MLYFTYILFSIPLILLSYADLSTFSCKVKNRIFCLLSLIILFFSVANSDKSGDFINYVDSYNNISSFTEYINGSSIKGYGFEPGYIILNLFVKQFIEDSYVGVTCIMVLSLCAILSLIPRISSFLLISLSIYFAHFYWWIGFVLLRQSLAMFVVFPVIRLTYYGKYWKAIFFILLASCFHASSLIWLFFLLLYRIRNILSIKKRFFIVVFCSILGYSNAVLFFLEIIGRYIPRGDVLVSYIIESNSDRVFNPLAYFEMIFIWIIAIRYREKLMGYNAFFDVYEYILFVSIIVSGLFINFEIATRFAMFFNFFSYLFLIPSFLFLFRKTISNRLSYLALLSFYLFIFYVRFVLITI